MNTGDIEDRMKAQDIATPLPTDVEAPKMYLHTVYILGGIAAAGVLGIIVLAILNRPIDAGLVAIASAAAGYIGGLLTRQ